MVAHHETRHGFEHRNIDALTDAGAVSMHQTGKDRAHGVEPDDTVHQRIRHIARRTVTAARHQMRQRRTALDEIVIGGLRCIGAVLAESKHAGVDQSWIDGGDVLIAQPQPLHRLRAHVVD